MKSKKPKSVSPGLFFVVCACMTFAVVGLINSDHHRSMAAEATSTSSNPVTTAEDTAVPLSGKIYSSDNSLTMERIMEESNRFTVVSWGSHDYSYGEVPEKVVTFDYFIIQDLSTGSLYAVFVNPVNDIVQIH